MVQRDFSIEDAVSFGWNTVKNNLWFFIGLTLIVFIIDAIPQGLAQAALQGENPGTGRVALGVILDVVAFVVSALTTLGVVYITLRYVANQSGELGDLFSQVPRLLPYIGAAILTSIVVAIGALLCILPGIYLGIRLGLFQYFIVDNDAGPIEAMQRSWELTKGFDLQFKLFLFYLLLFVINVLGALACGVGLLVTVPLTALAIAFVYRTLREQPGLARPALA